MDPEPDGQRRTAGLEFPDLIGQPTSACLADELEAFCREHDLPFMPAEDLLASETPTAQERDWLEAFSQCWTRAQALPSTHMIARRSALELAGTFVVVLREMTSPEEFERCMAGLAAPDDLVDANVVMATAFMRIHRRCTWLPSDVEDGTCTQEEADADLNLWNRAAMLFARTVHGSL